MNQNGDKGQNYIKVVKRVGYGHQFQYKLSALATYLSPHFCKLKNSSVSVPQFIIDATVTKKNKMESL